MREEIKQTLMAKKGERKRGEALYKEVSYQSAARVYQAELGMAQDEQEKTMLSLCSNILSLGGNIYSESGMSLRRCGRCLDVLEYQTLARVWQAAAELAQDRQMKSELQNYAVQTLKYEVTLLQNQRTSPAEQASALQELAIAEQRLQALTEPQRQA